MSYSIKNLREVQDFAPKFGLDRFQEAHFAGRELGAEQTGLAFHVVKPGQRQGFAHRHEKAEEVYVVLSGTGRVKLEDDIHDVGPLDAVRVAPEVRRAFEASDDAPLEVLAFGPRHEGDGEILKEDFWA
jgi:mannose-6-phosphate isomerase-like protein (cupin superfamily)